MSPIRRHSNPVRISHEATKQAPLMGHSQPPGQRRAEPGAFDRAPFTGWLTVAFLLGILGIVIHLLFFRSGPSEKLRSELGLQSEPEATPQLARPSDVPSLQEGVDLRSPNLTSGGNTAPRTFALDSSGKGPEVVTRGETLAEFSKAITSPPPTPKRPAASLGELTELIFQGDKALSLGDIAVARGYYESAYDAGSSEAATRLGRTFDPLFLAERATLGLQPDPSVALDWYRRADKAGDQSARDFLDTLLFWLHERSRAKELEAQRQ